MALEGLGIANTEWLAEVGSCAKSESNFSWIFPQIKLLSLKGLFVTPVSGVVRFTKCLEVSKSE